MRRSRLHRYGPPVLVSVRIACCSDSAPPVFRGVARAIADRDPDVVLFGGDARAVGFGVTRLGGARWRRAWGDLADRVLTVPGNHDYRAGQREPWRWSGAWDGDPGFRAGPSGAFLLTLERAAILGIATGPGARRVPETQLEWAASALGGVAADVHRIAIFHSPAFPVSTHIGSSLDGDPNARDRLWITLEDLGVSLVVNGHEHLYARREIVRRTVVTQVITGGAGADLSPVISGDVVAASSEHHAVLLEVADELLTGTAFTPGGEIIDAFTVTRADAGVTDVS